MMEKKTVFTKMINRKPFSSVGQAFCVLREHGTRHESWTRFRGTRAICSLLDNCVATIICETTHEKRLVLP